MVPWLVTHWLDTCVGTSTAEGCVNWIKNRHKDLKKKSLHQSTISTWQRKKPKTEQGFPAQILLPHTKWIYFKTARRPATGVPQKVVSVSWLTMLAAERRLHDYYLSSITHQRNQPGHMIKLWNDRMWADVLNTYPRHTKWASCLNYYFLKFNTETEHRLLYVGVICCNIL